MATTIDNILNKIAELEAKLQESGGVNSEEILEELRILKEMLKDGYNVNLGDSFSAKTIGPAIATGVEILTPSRVVELVHETGENRDLIISQYGVTKTLENYATKDYVGTNGGKIDNISIDGVTQEIDENKNVNIKLENYATKDYVESNGGKIDSLSINGQTLPIDNNKNVEIPTIDEPEGLETFETESIGIDDFVSEDSDHLVTSGAVYNAIKDKTIGIDTTSTSPITLKDNTSIRLGTISTLTINNASSYPLDFMCEVVFVAGASISIDYSALSLTFSGDNVENNVFIPQANKTYNILFFNNSNSDTASLQAIVRGV